MEDLGDIIEYCDLNKEQKIAYDIVMSHFKQKSGKQLFMMIYG